MLGQYFIFFAPQPDGTKAIRIGIVKNKVGAERWQLEFEGVQYRFSNVFSAEQLEHFVFFDSPAARNAFIEDLKAQQAPPPVEAPPVEAPEVTQ